MPRELIDAKAEQNDDDFFVLLNGEEINYDETVTPTDRTLTILFQSNTEEIEIIGTSLGN